MSDREITPAVQDATQSSATGRDRLSDDLISPIHSLMEVNDFYQSALVHVHDARAAAAIPCSSASLCDETNLPPHCLLSSRSVRVHWFGTGSGASIPESAEC